jgi:pimeloyl-ACP methyl ester carboxylesterase
VIESVSANGLRFAYLEAGQGPLVLLLHGFPDTAHGWQATLGVLAQAGYRAVAPFLRGYAPTEVPVQRNVRLEVLAEDAVALVSALGHERAVLVGHDWGAATAYCAASMAPERFEKLVTIGIPHPLAIRPSLKLAWAARHFLRFRLPGALAMMQANDFAHVDELYRRWSPTWKFGPEETAPVKRCFAEPGSLDCALGYYRAAKPTAVPAALRRRIDVDTLVFAGVGDPALGSPAYHAAARRFTKSYRVVELPGGHFVHRESPEGFHSALVEFLRT